ncbi:hypothetical protein [Streptomyces sp. NPDC088812]
MTRTPHETSGEPNPLHGLSLDRLRRRTSEKWRGVRRMAAAVR